MKALTIRQPWASLIAHGAKTIETRSWSTKYRGPLAIHAGKRADDDFAGGGWWVGGGPRLGRGVPRFLWGPLNDSGCEVEAKCVGHAPTAHTRSLPLGAVVATCTLADVVPIRRSDDPPEDWRDEDATDPGAWLSVANDGTPTLYLHRHPGVYGSIGEWVSDQLPYGDFTQGMFAWLLEDVKVTTERCPACWRWWTTSTAADDPTHETCPVCGDDGKCDPIPAKGKQGLWEWLS